MGGALGKTFFPFTFSGAQKRAEMLRHPYILGGPQTKGDKIRSGCLTPHPCLLGGPKERGNATSPLHSRGSPTPNAGRKSEGATSPCLLGAQKRAQVLCHPCILGGPQRQAQGQNQKWLTGGHIAYKHAF